MMDSFTENVSCFNPMVLTGKQILITGASSGMGRQTAITASRLGARIICVARREKRLKETISLLSGEGHRYYSVDLSDVSAIEEFVKRMNTECGCIDGLVHCAGDVVTRPLHMNKYDKMLGSFGAVYFAFTEIVRCLMKKGYFADGGSIVAVSSVSVTSVHGRKAKVAYSSARAALECTARCLASELAERRIRVNTVQAGLVETEMAQNYLSDNADSEKVREFDTRQLLGKIGVEEIANVFAFLLSDATTHITGANVLVDGGYLQG